ncbi:MAG: 4Fe-4S dicluster domain-containing protein [Desulfobacteraceae bacterium]|nr:4Fe-4S dicluster domain-containing protein [Desulfobacteraceae bacterium]
MDTITSIKSSEIKQKAPLRPIESLTDMCMACGTCSAGCPLTGIEGFDPRKIVRMVLMGMDKELVESKLPWLCTMCGKCEYACPMGINIVSIIRTARGMVKRENVPGMIHKGVELCLKTGNNIGLPKEDFIFIIEDVGEELAGESGFSDFKIPFDKNGANLLHTLHNKLVNTQNEDLKHWWKIFHIAKEDWTIPSQNWEGVNWGLFSGDDEAMKCFVGRIVENMEKLEIANLMYPE